MSVVLAYKNFAANRNISHIGLGVAALNTAKVLKKNGIKTEVWPILSADDLTQRLQSAQAQRARSGRETASEIRAASADPFCAYSSEEPIGNVIISAPWIPSAQLQKMANTFPDTHFSVNCHSNVGFLQADRNGVKLMREVMEMETGSSNIHLAGNSRRFCEWIRFAFGAPCAYQPNLYYLTDEPMPPHHPFCGGPLRIGAFGATRPLKNLMSAAGAALELARTLKAPLEFWLSGGRAEGGGEAVLGAVREMLNGLPNVTLQLNGWQTWPQFRRTVGHMHLLFQPSYTESFNMVTADGVAEGVASVVSSAIDWAPHDWKADVDDVLDISRIGRRLLFDPCAARDGRRALEHYVKDGVAAYKHFFSAQ